MTAETLHLPLVRWDGLHLVLHLEPLEARLRAILERAGELEGLRVTGRGDLLRVEAALTWRGARARVAVELGEIRLRARHVGFRVRRVVAAGAVRVPRRAILAMLRRRFPTLVTVFPDRGIVVIALVRWLPAELSLRVVTVQVVDGFLHLWLGPGGLDDLPRRQRAVLPADAENSGSREDS